MATWKNTTDETFVFPSLGLIVAPGDTFDTDEPVTTEGFEQVSGKKASAPVETPAPVVPADAPADAPATAEEGK